MNSSHHRRIRYVLPLLLTEVKGSILLGDLTTAANTLLKLVIPLLCGSATDERTVENVGSEALAELSLLLKQPLYAWRCDGQEMSEAANSPAKSVRIDLKALDYVFTRLEDPTPFTDETLVTLVNACGSIIEVQTFAIPEKLKLVG